MQVWLVPLVVLPAVLLVEVAAPVLVLVVVPLVVVNPRLVEVFEVDVALLLEEEERLLQTTNGQCQLGRG